MAQTTQTVALDATMQSVNEKLESIKAAILNRGVVVGGEFGDTNVIEKIKLNNVEQTITDKTVNIDAYSKSEINEIVGDIETLLAAL